MGFVLAADALSPMDATGSAVFVFEPVLGFGSAFAGAVGLECGR